MIATLRKKKCYFKKWYSLLLL